jgi:SSS family transporter
VRIAGALTFAFMVILYMAVVLYTPSIALAQVTGLSVALSICVCGIVCVIYTVAGGMKATIWNDFIQMIVIVVGLLVLIIVGAIRLDGNFWDINDEFGRIEFDNFDPDPTVRTSFWTQSIGGTFVSLAMYASSQTVIQKFLSVKKLKNAQKAVWVSAVTSTIFLVLVSLVGLIMFAYYAHCDPVKSGRIEKADQLVPLFVMDVMGDLHGLPGLFIAAAFSAALR